MSKFTAVISIFLISVLAQAGPIPSDWSTHYLAQMTNSEDSAIKHVNLVFDENDEMKGMFVETEWPEFNLMACEHGNPEGTFYPAEKLLTKRGVVTARCKGRDILILRATEKDHGFTITFKYLSNGIWNKYKKCKAELVYEPEWMLVNQKTGERIERMHIKAKWNGIKTIRGVCN